MIQIVFSIYFDIRKNTKCSLCAHQQIFTYYFTVFPRIKAAVIVNFADSSVGCTI